MFWLSWGGGVWWRPEDMIIDVAYELAQKQPPLRGPFWPACRNGSAGDCLP
jgi:hypothetical protein